MNFWGIHDGCGRQCLIYPGMTHYSPRQYRQTPFPHRLVVTLALVVLIAAAIIAAIWAFDSGENSRCNYYRHQGGPQWAIDRYCSK